MRETTHLGQRWTLSVGRGLTGLAEPGIWLGEFREGPRKPAFALDWVLSGNGTVLSLSILVNLIDKEG